MSNEIRCPSCDTAFTIDEAGYADIVRQVHGVEFDKALNERLAIAEREKLSELELAVSKVKAEMQSASFEKDNLITELKTSLKSSETEKELAIAEALAIVNQTNVSNLAARDKVINDLEAKIFYRNKISTRNLFCWFYYNHIIRICILSFLKT